MSPDKLINEVKKKVDTLNEELDQTIKPVSDQPAKLVYRMIQQIMKTDKFDHNLMYAVSVIKEKKNDCMYENAVVIETSISFERVFEFLTKDNFENPEAHIIVYANKEHDKPVVEGSWKDVNAYFGID